MGLATCPRLHNLLSMLPAWVCSSRYAPPPHHYSSPEESRDRDGILPKRGGRAGPEAQALQMSFGVWLGLCFQATSVLSKGMQRKTQGSSPKGRWQAASWLAVPSRKRFTLQRLGGKLHATNFFQGKCVSLLNVLPVTPSD